MLRKVVLTLGVVVATLVLLEVAAQAWLAWLSDDEDFAKYASLRQLEEASAEGRLAPARYASHRYLGYYPNPAFAEGSDRHNAHGYRGPDFPLAKPAGEFRIVCSGGSTTYASGVGEWKDAYPAQLQAILHERGHDTVRVINAGCGGWTTWEMLINLELRLLDLDPDMVVICEGINDVHPRLVWPARVYRGDNSGMRPANVSGMYMPGIFEYSALVRIVGVNSLRLKPHGDLTRSLDRHAVSYRGDEFRRQWTKGDYPSEGFAQVSAERMLEENPPEYFRRNVENMVVVARAHDVLPVLMTFAMSDEFPRQITSAPAYVSAIAATNAIMHEVAGRRGVPAFDLAAVMPKDAALYTDGRHTTPEGGRIKAGLLADYLIENALVP